MKKFLFTLFTSLCILSTFAYANTQVEKAYHDKQSNIQVEGSGKVIRILSDDNNGSRHQRFLLKLPSKLTLLVAHNIDLSKKIENLKEGDDVEFYGEYERNNKGGVLHWTHHDPKKKHKDGWLKHKSIIYK